MADISQEISAFQNAVYGEDVRTALVNLANKINNESSSADTTVTGYDTRLSAVEADGYVTTAKLADGAVTNAKLADGSVTDAKLAQSGGVLEEVNDLKSVFNATIKHNNVAMVFTQGSINASGSNVNSDTRIKTDYLYCPLGFTIDVPEGYKINVRYYTSNTKDSMIDSDGSGWIADSVFDKHDTNIKYIRVLLAKIGDSNISPADVTSPIYIDLVESTDKTLTMDGKSADAKATGDRINALNNVFNSVNNAEYTKFVVNNEIVRGNFSNGTIVSSTIRLSTSDYVHDSGVFTVVPNGLRVYIYIYDNNKTSLYRYDWTTVETKFCVPSGCYYIMIIAKEGDAVITLDENTVLLYKETSLTQNSNENTKIIDHFINTPSEIQYRLSSVNFWNKRIDSSLTYSITNDRICNIEPINVNSGETIKIIPYGTGLRLNPFFYTEVEGVKTKIYGDSTWRTGEFVYKATTNCKLVFNLSYATGHITPLNAEVYVFKSINTGGSSLPSYWTEYLDAQIPNIKSDIVNVGSEGDTFMLVTDTHWEYNRKKSPAIMKYIKDRTNVSFSVNCGDLIQGSPTVSEAQALLDEYNEQIKQIEPFYCIRGNHETNLDGAYKTGEMTEDDFYPIIDKPLENYLDTKQKVYFYNDNVSQKIRYIFIDININTTWLADVIANTPSGYSIVCFSHYLFVPSGSSYTDDLSIADKGNIIINTINNNLPNDVTVIGIFSGHTHRDFYTHSAAGYLLCCTACDANAAGPFDPFNPDRTEGTTNEQVIDVISIDTGSRTVNIRRIGAGNSRLGLTY